MNLKYFYIFIIILISVFFIIGCTEQNNHNQTNLSEKQEILKGFSLSPKSFQPEDFTNFLENTKKVDIISWAGDWNELNNIQNGGPKVITELASVYKYTPIVELQFFTQSSGQLIRPLDDTTKEIYKTGVINFVEKYEPKYLGIGIEVNVLYEKSRNDFEDFVSFYDEVYDSIKEKSPNTKIFTVFQLEKMKGLNGGLFGGMNDPKKSQWFLLEKFKSDVIVFTTYPNLIYKNPSEIPSDYYTEIKLHTSKSIAFIEIGWHSNASPVGWESSEEKQAEFIVIFSDLTNDLNCEFLIWSFMYDQDIIEPFNSMGLINKNGKTKLGWNKWVNKN
jgi:hypothetical protein